MDYFPRLTKGGPTLLPYARRLRRAQGAGREGVAVVAAAVPGEGQRHCGSMMPRAWRALVSPMSTRGAANSLPPPPPSCGRDRVTKCCSSW